MHRTAKITSMPDRQFLEYYRRCKAALPPAAAARTFAYIAEWHEVLDEQGLTSLSYTSEDDGLGLEAFLEHVAESRASVYRRNAEFRRVFPDCATPSDLLRRAA